VANRKLPLSGRGLVPVKNGRQNDVSRRTADTIIYGYVGVVIPKRNAAGVHCVTRHSTFGMGRWLKLQHFADAKTVEERAQRMCRPI
jgi:hypothetical protein